MKKVLLVLLALLCLSGFAFAADSGDVSWMTSYNDPGKLNAYASVGFYVPGVDVSIAPEYMIGKFNIGPVPLEWGVEVRGMVGFSSLLGYSWVDWGVAPMATLHWGVDFGKPWRFDLYIGAGLGIYGSSGATYYGYTSTNPVNFGFASFDGVAWQFADNMAIISEGGTIGNTGTWGVGFKYQF